MKNSYKSIRLRFIPVLASHISHEQCELIQKATEEEAIACERKKIAEEKMGINLIFTTNIDRYKGKFPIRTNLPIPRKGEKVGIKESVKKEFLQKGYPCELEVKTIRYQYESSYTNVFIELHYNNIDLALMVANKIEPYN